MQGELPEDGTKNRYVRDDLLDIQMSLTRQSAVQMTELYFVYDVSWATVRFRPRKYWNDQNFWCLHIHCLRPFSISAIILSVS